MTLELLLRSLTEEELSKLDTQLHVPERSGKLIERLRSSPKPPTTKELCEEFNLSKSNLYRLCSELTDEIVTILGPGGEFSRLDFYRKKFFASLFTSELLRVEKKLIGSDRDVLERFYEYAFEGLAGFGVSDIDTELMSSIGMKWHKSKYNPPEDDELAIQMRIIFIRISSMPTVKKLTVDKMYARSRTLLDPVAARGAITPNPVARYYYYQSEWKAANYANIVGEERAVWLHKSCEVIASHQESFPPRALEATQLQLAYERAIYCGEIEDAYKQYMSAYNGQVPDSSRNALLLIRFVRVSIISGHYDTAHSLLNVINSHPYTRMTLSIYQPYLQLSAILHIIEGNIPIAEEMIQTMRNSNVDENYFLSYDVDIRALEAVCALKTGDLEYAETLVLRDIKWLQSRKYALSQSPWPYFYKAIKAYILFKQTGKKPTRLLEKQFDEFTAVVRIFSLLIEEEVNELFRGIV
jgi:hypothetical protein